MGIGIVAITTSAKKEQSGPPFVSGAADNGLSVDSVSGKIVLGNDVGDPAAPGALLSNREILTEDTIGGAFSILLNAIQTGIITTLSGVAVRLASTTGQAPAVTVTDSASGTPSISAIVSGGLGGTATVQAVADANDTARLSLSSGSDMLKIEATGAGVITWTTNSGVLVMGLDTVNFQWAVGPGSANFTGADFCVGGSTTYRRFVIGKAAGAYNVDRDLDSAKIFTNSAANTFN
ncbi:MAG TPA: hypothetical protein VLD19_18345, partial [Chitinophagaceae bacterium]|nr:hypothetical protein [Chitinophagaceae bacterium]